MEKALFNQVGEVKGKTSDLEDSFSFQFTPQNENLKRTRGALFTLVTVTGTSDEKLAKAKAYYHAFQSSYYAKASGSILNGLSETLDHVDKEFAREGETLKYSLVAAVFWGAVLYLAKTGNSVVFVSRSGKLKKLDFNKVASGVLEDQDTVCLASEKFADEVKIDDLGEIFDSEKFQDVLEKIDKKIADVPAAVCDVIRLSVNSPSHEAQPVTIGEIDAEGEVNLAESTESVEETNTEVTNETESPPQPETVNRAQKTTFALWLSKLQNYGKKIVSFSKDKLSLAVASILKPWRKSGTLENVDHVAIRKQRIVQVVGLILIVLVVSLVFGLISGSKNQKAEEVNSFITKAEQNLSEAANIKSIDPTRALALVNSAKENTAKAKELSPKDSRLSELESQEAKLIAEINRAYSLDKLETFADFSKLNKEVQIDRLSLSSSQILATDEKNGKIYSVEISSKDLNEIEQSLVEPKNITSFPSGFYIQTKDGITRLDTSQKVTSVANSSNWGEIAGAANYDSNLYLLDKGKNEIWKYIATSKGLGSSRAYIVGDKPNLAQASGIAIDSFVWVVTQTGEIFKFALGKKQEFKVSNMQESFSNAVDIFTTPTAKNLYILDSGKARLVAISKDGVYQAQYSNDQLHNATSVVVNEEQKTAYVAVDGKILSIKLK